jgi:hypothetical protein
VIGWGCIYFFMNFMYDEIENYLKRFFLFFIHNKIIKLPLKNYIMLTYIFQLCYLLIILVKLVSIESLKTKFKKTKIRKNS